MLLDNAKTVWGYFVLIPQGKTFLDKLAIFVYLIKTPVHYVYKKMNIPYNHTFFREIKLSYNGLILNCGNGVSSVWIARKGFEKKLSNLIDLKEGNFIDIGGHIGKYTCKIAKNIGNKGKVLVIEPEKNNLELLKKNISENKLNNVIVQEVICSNKDGYQQFYVSDQQTGSGSHSLYITKNKKAIKLKSKKLDSIVKETKFDNIKLIKIDVEGAEVDVINGALNTIKKNRPTIVLECWNKANHDSVNELLKKLGYNMSLIEDNNYIASPN